MVNLFDRNTVLNQHVFRNIVFIQERENLFDDLIDGNLKASTQIAMDAEARVINKSNAIPRDFHYVTAIAYPFEIKACEKTRYSNGEYCVWYGSLEHLTTIYETVYHMFRSTLAIEGVKEIVRRQRAVYTVHGKAILLDLRGKEKEYPDLIADHYSFTQNIGTIVQKEGHPGLLAPSARTEGNNVIIFNQNVLKNPIVVEYIEYALDPVHNITTVTNASGKILMNIRLEDF